MGNPPMEEYLRYLYTAKLILLLFIYMPCVGKCCFLHGFHLLVIFTDLDSRCFFFSYLDLFK